MNEILAAINLTANGPAGVVLAMLVIGLAVLAGRGILWLLGGE